MFLFVLLVLSESQFKMKYPFYYARLSTIKNVQSGLDEIGSFGLSSQYYVPVSYTHLTLPTNSRV